MSKATSVPIAAAATATAPQSLDELFNGFATKLEAQSQKREDVQKEVRALNQVFRNVQFAMHKVQSVASDEKAMAAIATNCLPHFLGLKPIWANVSKLIGDENPEKYRELWRFSVQQLLFFAAYAHWLRTHTLLTMNQAVSLLAGNGDAPATTAAAAATASSSGAAAASSAAAPASVTSSFAIDIEDYLHGVVSVPRELSRLCMNCVRSGNYRLPAIINTFVSDLYSGFRLLNLRNDALRRKFDAIKYDVQKIEEVMYDVSVRGLTASQAVAKAEHTYTTNITAHDAKNKAHDDANAMSDAGAAAKPAAKK